MSTDDPMWRAGYQAALDEVKRRLDRSMPIMTLIRECENVIALQVPPLPTRVAVIAVKPVVSD